MADVNRTLTIIALCDSRLNTPIKRQIMAEWVKKKATMIHLYAVPKGYT